MFGVFFAKCIPPIATMEEIASAKLFNASTVIAIELDAIPTTAFAAASDALVTIPTTLVRTIMAARSIVFGFGEESCVSILRVFPC